MSNKTQEKINNAMNVIFNQNGGSRTDTLIKLVLIFFISLLSFSVGTFVGKQFSDSQHRMASLESEYDSSTTVSRDTASIPSDNLDIKPDEALTDKDIQQISEEFAKPADAQQVATAPAPEAATETKVKDPAAQAANRLVENKAPSENKPEEPSRIPSSFPSVVAGSAVGKYTIQISSHQSEDEANQKASTLKTKGYTAFVVPAAVKGKTWYRVSVGLFDKMDEAKEYRERLAREADITTSFIQTIVN